MPFPSFPSPRLSVITFHLPKCRRFIRLLCCDANLFIVTLSARSSTTVYTKAQVSCQYYGQYTFTTVDTFAFTPLNFLLHTLPTTHMHLRLLVALNSFKIVSAGTLSSHHCSVFSSHRELPVTSSATLKAHLNVCLC